jgi:nitronate monooxygenase
LPAVPWSETRVTELLRIRYPLIQAPMARISTAEVAAAVSEAGGLGSVAGAALDAGALGDAVAAVRARTRAPFAVNLFAPREAPAPSGIDEMIEFLAPWRERLGLPPDPSADLGAPPSFEAQFAALLDARPAAFSFTFGIPPAEALRAAREAGIATLGTATTVAEAEALERAGVDAVVAQGAEAGGHRGTFAAEFESALVGTLALVPRIVDRIGLPVIAAGGIMDGRGIAAALALGAEAAQLGTAFIGVDESGAPPAYIESLTSADETATTVTAAFTGRHARAVRTAFVDELERAGIEIPPYPIQQGLMLELFGAGLERGELDAVLRLAGQGAASIRRLPAAELVGSLVAETESAIASLAGG